MQSFTIEPTTATIEEIRRRFSPKARQCAMEQRAREVAGILARLLAESSPDLQAIRVRGYTPSWNDGSPCAHHQQVFLNGVNEDGEACSTEFEDEDVPDVNEDVYPFDAHKQVAGILDAMECYLNEVFDTDWSIRVRRTDKGILFEQTTYDCGR